MPEGVPIGVQLGALAIGFAVGTLLGAVVLRWAVALYNKVASWNEMLGGAPSPVPKPAFGRAMWITFEISVFQTMAGLLIFGLFTGDGAATRGRVIDGVAQLLLIPIGLVIQVGVLSAKLPTTIGRAILVSLCEMFLILLVVGVLVAFVVSAFGVALMGP
jgi:hypothetical protein